MNLLPPPLWQIIASFSISYNEFLGFITDLLADNIVMFNIRRISLKTNKIRTDNRRSQETWTETPR